MKKSQLGLLFVLIVVLVASCAPEPTASPLDSPLPPTPLPVPSALERDPLNPAGWEETLVAEQTAYFVEVQIYEPLAWTDIDWDGETIWMANNLTQELVGLDRRGEQSRTIPFPQIDDMPANVLGVASAGDRIWIADVAHRTFFALDRESGEVVDQFDYPGTAQGIDWDGSSLWIVRVEGAQLERRDEQGQLLESRALQGDWITGMTLVGDRVYFVDPGGSTVRSMSFATGELRDEPTVPLGGMSFNGLAWAGDYLLALSDMVGKLYAIPLEE